MISTCKQYFGLSTDWLLKSFVLVTSLYHVWDFAYREKTSQSILYVRNVWLPQSLVALILFITSTLSSIFRANVKREIIYGDVFVLTTVEKLITIGYNSHLIIFYVTLNDIDFAFMILPVTVFLFFIIDAIMVVAYLDTVFFNISEWQSSLRRKWTICMLTSILPQHILCSFLYHHHASMSVQFTKPFYKGLSN